MTETCTECYEPIPEDELYFTPDELDDDGKVAITGSAYHQSCYEKMREEHKKDVDRRSKASDKRKAPELLADTKADRAQSRVRSVRKLLDEGLPPIEWSVQNLLTQQGIMLVATPPKQYKTYLAVLISLCLAEGTAILDAFNTTAGKVLYIDEENGERPILRRFEQVSKGHEIEPHPENLLLVSHTTLKLDEPEGKTILEHLIQTNDVRVIILDSLVRFIGGDEDKASDVRKVFETLKDLIERYNVAFIILHHTRKGNGKRKGLDDLRGSSDFAAFPDSILTLDPVRDGFELRIIANRHVGLQEIKPLFIRVVSDRQQGPVRFENCGHGGASSRKVEAKVALLAWFQERQIKEFRTSEATGHLKSLKMSRNAFYEGRDALLTEGVIAEQRPGFYSVQPGNTFDVRRVVP